MRSRRLLEAIHDDLRALRKQLAERPLPSGPPGSEAEEWAALDKVQASHEREVEELVAQLDALRESESYRLGHAIVRTFRFPAWALRREPRQKGRAGRLRRAVSSLGGRTQAIDREPLPVPEGKRLLGPLNEKHTTTMFMAWGLSADELQSLIDEIARLQLMLRDFKPVFVTDSDFWSPFEHYGYWFEYIPPADEWTRHGEATDWPSYVSARIGSIIKTYDPKSILIYEGGTVGEALRRGVLNSVVGRPARSVEKAALLPERHAKK